MNCNFEIFKFTNFSTNNDIALILLNYWFSIEKENNKYLSFFKCLWKKAKFTASVDGGTNFLHTINKEANFSFVPNLISGDFDSVSLDLLSFYKAKGSEVVETEDQNYTDFTKCLKILANKYATNSDLHSIDTIVCMVGQSDRLDHVMSNINTLITSRSSFPSHMNIILLTEDCCTCVLSQGKTVLDLKMHCHFQHPTSCSFFPIKNPALVSTVGLKSNLQNQVLEFGSFFNAENELDGNSKMQIETDNLLVLLFALIVV